MQHQRLSINQPRQPRPTKPALPMVQLPIYRVKQQHLETYLAQVYQMEGFDFRIASGATPGMCPEYNVSPTLSSAWNAKEDADRIRHGHRTMNVALILNILCLDGYIPAGRYIIDTHPEQPPAQVYRNMLMQMEDPNHPMCMAFKQEHCHDHTFTQQANQLDRMVTEQKEKK